MSWELTLQTNWRCANGKKLADLGEPFGGSLITERIDGRSPGTLVLAEQYYPLLQNRLVIFFRDAYGRWAEGRIRRIDRVFGAPAVSVTLMPPWFDLAGADLVRETNGARRVFDFTETRTATEFLTQRVLTNLAEDGLGWLSLGDVDFDRPVTVQWSRLDRAAFCLKLQEAYKAGELALVATDFTTYRLTFVRQLAVTLPVIDAEFGERLASMSMATGFEDFYSAIRMGGEVPNEAESAASGANNVWRVVSVTALGAGSTAPFAVVLEDPAQSGVSPIQLDGVFAIDPNGVAAGAYLQLENGAPLAILESRAATGDVLLPSAPTVGEYVSIVADAEGRALDRIAWPRAVALYGLVIADAHVAGANGERNYLANPGLDQGLTDFSTPSGSRMTLVPRTLPAEVSGLVNAAAGSPPGPAHFYVDGFPPNTVLVRGDAVHVAGDVLTVGTSTLSDIAGAITVPLSATLATAIPAGTVLTSAAFPGGYFVTVGVHGIGAGSLALYGPLFITQPWLSGDVLSVDTVLNPACTVDGVAGSISQFVTLHLATTIPYDIQVVDGSTETVRVQHGGSVRTVRVSSPYTAGDATITVRHPDWTPQAALRGDVRPFGAIGDVVLASRRFVTEHLVSGTPTWGTDKRVTVTISPALAHDTLIASSAETVIAWRRADGERVGVLTLENDAAATDTTLDLLGGELVHALIAGDLLNVPAYDAMLVDSVTLDNTGAGAVRINPAPGGLPIDNAAVTITRTTDWDAADGGGANVALIESAFTLDDVIPSTGAASPRSRAFTVIVPPNETRQVTASVALTAWSPVRASTPQPTAYAKIALVDTVTNTIVAWAHTAPDNADSLTSPDNARIPLAWDAVGNRWIPLHVHLRCSVVLAQTATLQLRVYSFAGIDNTFQARVYYRWGVVHIPGRESTEYFVGSLDNTLVLAAQELLARDAVPGETYEVGLQELMSLVSDESDWPGDAVMPLLAGRRIRLAPTAALQRIIEIDHTPSLDGGRVLIGRQPIGFIKTLGEVAVVSIGGTR